MCTDIMPLNIRLNHLITLDIFSSAEIMAHASRKLPTFTFSCQSSLSDH